MLVHNPDKVNKYTHIILDEIHERSTDADFSLLVVRELASKTLHVKLVIMSATMQGSLIVNYFREHFPKIAGPYFVGARHYPVASYFIDELEGVPRSQCFWDECQLKAAQTLQQLAVNKPVESLKAALYAKPCVSTYAQEVCTEVIISQAQLGESILVFLPGLSEIVHYFESLSSEVRCRGIADHFRLFVLHSQVPFEDQKEAFDRPLGNLVHVILATNIAESSITLPQLRLVINFGIYRRMQYDSKRHISCLVKRWCSRASCEQRAGRAGRVFAGTVIHLFTRHFYDVVLPAHDPPEILTAPIAKLVLQAKRIGVRIGYPRPSDFLSRAIEPPMLQQLEAALHDLVELGAIEGCPGEEVDEEAEITFFGHFSLSLPADLDLCRIVFFGLLFGCGPDAVVMAAAMSLSQDVLSLPSRVVIKDEKTFRCSLARSCESRRRLDSGMYCDSILVLNLFKEWLLYRSQYLSHKHCVSRFTLARGFSSIHACRWERLIQLESAVSEIARRTLNHIPPDTSLHSELKTLANLHHRGGLQKLRAKQQGNDSPHNHVDSHATSPVSDSFRVAFCRNPNVIRATLVAAFPSHLIVGVQTCKSLLEKEKSRAIGTLRLMQEQGLDVGRSLVMRNLTQPSKAALQHLVDLVLPHHHCQTTTAGNTGLITFNHPFDSNPLTEELRSSIAVPSPTSSSSSPPRPAFKQDHFPTHSQEKIVVSALPPELILFWQYGERRPEWNLDQISVPFPRPEHPLATSWFRLTAQKEKVHVLSWRNPTGLVCDVSSISSHQSLPYLAVAAHLQGFSTPSSVSAKNVALLPLLRDGPTAAILALAFQPPHTKLFVLVNKSRRRITGVKINSFEISPLPIGSSLDSTDLVCINDIREAISKAFSSKVSTTFLPTDLLHSLPQQLLHLLQRKRHHDHQPLTPYTVTEGGRGSGAE